MTQEEATSLFQLRCNWQDVYRVEFSYGVWSARRLDDAMHLLTADTAGELRTMMQDDYAGRLSGERAAQA